ncbi:50S ribosomal protein L16 [Candidatus Woesearchaeota archaeon]|nr:50S ribosomal protein L16 [Candidatus Woesearchaeota archaeon]
MARLRKFVAYRNLKRPYTRKSKYRKYSYVKANPVCRIAKFHTGNTKREFEYKISLISKDALQIRDNALEAARLSTNRTMERKAGRHNYHFILRTYPHNIIREHALASGAGADRFSTGMSRAFGTPTGIAARIKQGQSVFDLYVNKENVDLARKAIKKAKYKLPCTCRIEVKKVK